MQVAAASPQYRDARRGAGRRARAREERLPRPDGGLGQAGQRDREDHRGQARRSFYGEVVLPEQPSIRDPKIKVSDVIAAAGKEIGATVADLAVRAAEGRRVGLDGARATASARRARAPHGRGAPFVAYGPCRRSRYNPHRHVCARLQARPPEALRRSPHGRAGLRHRSRGRHAGRPRHRRGAGAGRRDRVRHRRRQHLPRRHGEREGHGPRDRRLHGHAGHRHQRPRAAGRPREAGRRHARGHRHRDARGRRAVHPAARDPPPREGPRRDLRGRHRQPVLHDRHGGGAARHGDQGRRHPEGHQGRRHLHGRPGHQSRRHALRADLVPAACSSRA